MDKVPYIGSVCDPFRCRGAIIPDGASETATFSLVRRFPIGGFAQTNGVYGFVLGIRPWNATTTPGSLLPIPIDISGDKTHSWEWGYKFGEDASIDTLIPATDMSDVTNTLKLDDWDSSTSLVPETFSAVRLVSMGVNLQFTGNFTDSEGSICMAVVPPGYSRDISATTTNLSYVTSMPGMKLIPINTLNGATSIYIPFERKAHDFVQISGENSNIYHEANESGEWSAALYSAAASEIWCVVFGTSGTTDVNFYTTVVMNVEAVPLTNRFIPTTSNTMDDSLGLDFAMSSLRNMPRVHEGSQEVNGSDSWSRDAFAPMTGRTMSRVSTSNDTRTRQLFSAIPSHTNRKTISNFSNVATSGGSGFVNANSSTNPGLTTSVVKNSLTGTSSAINSVVNTIDKFSPLLELGIEAIASLL